MCLMTQDGRGSFGWAAEGRKFQTTGLIGHLFCRTGDLGIIGIVIGFLNREMRPAQRIPIPRLRFNCNMTSSFTQSSYSYTATAIRKNMSWLVSHQSADVSWNVLEEGAELWENTSAGEHRAE